MVFYELNSLGLRRFLNHFFLFQFLQFRRDDDLAIRRVGIVIEVLLVIILGLVKRFQQHNLRHNWMLEIFLCREF